MSLLRLLTAGKSLVGMRDAESRYRVTSQRLLPHFGSTRNPFSNRAKAETAKIEARPPVDHNKDDVPAEKPNLAGPSGEPVVALRGASDHRAVLARFDPRNLGMALWRRMAALLRRGQGKLCELLPHSGSKAVKPLIPRFPKPPVQGELSLDRIKVVRNDLSDSDLEVVPAKPSAASATTAPAARPVETADSARSPWGRATTRVAGSGKA